MDNLRAFKHCDGQQFTWVDRNFKKLHETKKIVDISDTELQSQE